jgi:hypothetical protein
VLFRELNDTFKNEQIAKSKAITLHPFSRIRIEFAISEGRTVFTPQNPAVLVGNEPSR